MENSKERIQLEVMAFIMAHGINTTKLTPITAFQDVPIDIRFEVFCHYNKICKNKKNETF